jgi:pentatricopeptide repeat protein
VSILIAQGIYPSLFAFNYLLRSALHTQDFKGFRDTLATMTTHGIDFGADTYEVLFEELFVRNDLRGCLDMMYDMRSKGISPSRIAVRYIMKLCLNEDSESVLLHAIEECKKFGFPFDVHMCNALLSFYCKNNMDDELEKTLDMMSDHGINLNASSYTRLLYYYQSHGQQGKVSFLIQHMLDSGMLPDNRILDNYDFQPILDHAVDNLQKQPSPFQFDDDVFRLFENDTEEEQSSDLKFNE